MRHRMMDVMNTHSPLRKIAIGTLVLCVVFLAVSGILEDDLVTTVWVATVIPLLFNWRNSRRGKPSAFRPDSPHWPVAKLCYVMVLGMGGVALIVREPSIFARISGVLLIATALGYLVAFYYARRPETEAL